MKRWLILMGILVLALNGCGGGGSGGSVPKGSSYSVNVGPDRTVKTGSTVTLNASISSGANVAYEWSFSSKPAGSTATISDSTALTTTFIPDKDGIYVIYFTTSDGTSTRNAILKITSTSGNLPPVADAGPDQNVTTGSLVSLDGSGSSDADGDPLTYSWTFTSKPAGSSASLSNPTVANPAFTADVDGTYVLSLTVNDGTVNSQADSVTITAATGNSAPVADAGPDQNVTTGSLVSLDGSGSSDADGDPLTYSWTFTSKPAGSSASLSDPTAVNPTFVADIAGTYVVELVVNDGTVDSQPDTVTVGASGGSSWPEFRENNQRTGLSTVDTSSTTAHLKWSYPTGNSVESSPAIGSDGTIYVGSDDNKLYAINPDGSLKWSYTTGSLVKSSPAIGSDGTIYVGSEDDKLYAINPDGSLKWSYPTGGGVFSSPAIGSDGTIYVGSEDNKLYAINPDSSLKWSYPTGSWVASSPAIGSDGTIYIGSADNKLYAVNPDGSLKWSYATGFLVDSSPAIGSDGTIYVVSYDDNLYAINPDGSLKWSYTAGNGGFSSPAIGSDGTIYVGSSDNKLYAIH